MSSLCSLPEELRCYLFEFVHSQSDRRTVTKLNRACYQDMNSVIYTNMQVEQKFLTHDVSNKLHHFKHTTKVKIGGDFDGPHEQTDYEKFNFALVINACDAKRVKKFTFDMFLKPDALRFVSERLHRVEYLKLSGIELAELPWEKLSNFRALKRIQVEGDITEACVKAICEAVPKLQGLDIYEMRRCGDLLGDAYQLLQYIGGLKELKRLCISYNEDWGTGNFYDSIAGLEKLEHLDLYCSKVDDTFLANLVQNSLNIKFLEINRTNVTDQGVRSISKLQYLRHLDLSNCKITNHALRHISKTTSLRTLILSSCKDITDDGLVHLPNLKHLINLDLKCCRNLSDIGVSYLSVMTTLQKLKLEACSDLTDEALSHIGKLSFMRKLNLSVNPNFTDNGLKHLVHLRFLHTVYFSHCDGISQEGVDKAGFADHVKHSYNEVEDYGF